MPPAERPSDDGPPTDPEASARDRILDAAEDLFAKDGFDATPTSRIAANAEVPKGLIHYYFRRKIDLLKALVDRHDDDELDLGPLVVPGDPAASLRRLAEVTDASVKRSPMLRHLLWREADTHDAVRDAGRNRLERFVGQIKTLLVRAHPACAGSPHLDSAATLVGLTLSYRHSVIRHGDPPGDGNALMDFIGDSLLRATP